MSIFEEDRNFKQPLHILHGNKQRRDRGDAGSVGQEKGDYADWNGRYDTPCLEAGTERKADSGRAGAVPAERRVYFAGGRPVSGKST